MEFYAERFRTIFREAGDNLSNLGSQVGGMAEQVADWLRNRGGGWPGGAGGSGRAARGGSGGSGGALRRLGRRPRRLRSGTRLARRRPGDSDE